jgi:signal transduction histidine kinase/AmiR/NasT family two-component response regulator
MRKHGNREYRSWIEGLDLGVAGVSVQGTVLYANARFSEILGVSPEVNLEGKKLQDYLAASSAAEFSAALAATKNGKVEGEIQVLQESKLRIVNATFERLKNHSRNSLVRVVISEITKVLETRLTLQKYEESVQSLSARLLQLQDQERRRIARELHDTSGQDLAVMLMSLSQLSRKLEQGGVTDEMRHMLVDAMGLARKVEDQIRTLSYVMHPPLLDEVGLSAALRWYAEGFTKRTGISVEIVGPETAPRLTPERETGLFRVVQECLANVLRHSGSQRARIRLHFPKGAAEVSIRDYGKGIPTERLQTGSKEQSLGVGIAGMRERLQQLGGNLEIRSNSRGTLVLAHVPIEARKSPTSEKKVPVLVEQEAIRSDAPGRILVADDHEVTRRGIRSLLEDEPDLQVCGEARDGAEAIIQAKTLRPDLVLLDLTMPRLGGFGVINRIREMSRETKILVFTTHSYPHLVNTLRAAGCSGYVSKGKSPEELLQGIRTVLAGGEHFSRESATEARAFSVRHAV